MAQTLAMVTVSEILELEAQKLREKLLLWLAENNVERDILTMALADMIALTAVTLDLDERRSALNDRMQSFDARVRETYHKHYETMRARRERQRDADALLPAGLDRGRS